MASWVTRQASPVSVEPIGDLRAIYLEANGLTHLVDPVSAEVLLFLAAGPHPQETVRLFVANLVGDPELAWDEVSESLLLPLIEQGMIEAIV